MSPDVGDLSPVPLILFPLLILLPVLTEEPMAVSLDMGDLSPEGPLPPLMLLPLLTEEPTAVSPDVGDLSPEGPLPPLILLQQLLSAATQPSPIKAIFNRQELEVSTGTPAFPLGSNFQFFGKIQ